MSGDFGTQLCKIARSFWLRYILRVGLDGGSLVRRSQRVPVRSGLALP